MKWVYLSCHSSLIFISTNVAQDITRKFYELDVREKVRVEQGLSSSTSRWATCNTPDCIILDRYLNIQPWASNRSKLQVPEGNNDYINASPICLQQPSSKSTNNFKYIVMQGPKENTVSHTWRLIWEQVENPGVVVMLTEVEEGGKEKCYPYFPKDADSPPLIINEPDVFGDGFKATVQFSEKEEIHQGDAIEVRKLIMRVETPVKGDPENDEEDTVKIEEKTIWHLLYIRWPDFGVPAVTEVDSFFALMELSRAKNTVPENPRIVHCSAGVGRSGTFITLEYLMAELEAGGLVFYGNRDIRHPKPKGPTPTFPRRALTPPPFKTQTLITPPGTNYKNINLSSGSPAHHAAIAAKEKDMVFDTVDLLRQQRKTMVQSESQFHFIYRVLRRCWEVKYKGPDYEATKPESQDPFSD